MHKTHSFLYQSSDKNNPIHKSMNNFILLNQKRQIQQNYQWKPLNIKQSIIQRCNSYNKQISFGGSYTKKKSILVTLNRPQQTQNKSTSKSIRTSLSKKQIDSNILIRSKLKFNSKQKQHTESTQAKVSQKILPFSQNKQKMETKFNKFTNTATLFNKNVQNNIQHFKQTHLSERKISIHGLSCQSLLQKIGKAFSHHQRVIGVITIKRYGLRMRLKHAFAQICICQKTLHQNDHKLQSNQTIKNLVKQMLSINRQQQKQLYYFHLNKQPLISANQLPIFESVILASSSPILNIDNDIHFKVYQEAQKIEKQIKSVQTQLQIDFENIDESNDLLKRKKIYISPNKKKNQIQGQSSDDENNESTKYDWQLIPNIKDYVSKIVQNPQSIKAQQIIKDSKQIPSIKRQIRTLYNQKFDTVTKIQTGQNFRNPLLQDHSHYHSELKHKKILSAISSKLQQQNFIKNKHINKRETIQELIVQNKKQKQKQLNELKNPNILKRNVSNTLKTKKSVIRQLDDKNPLLFEQNIPYLMDKYGINRYEIHNLFTIFKTLQKISAMKYHQKNNTKIILQKGIDRSTFDEGMKRLDINPGDEVIKNICYFDDFISWEQFIKIVSIGLRKTPEQKLEAILIGIGGTNNGQLSKNQISIMIGNSLNKIFDSQQIQLRQYFTQVAMNDLDADGSGFVQVSEIKSKCLHVAQVDADNGQNYDLITFLLLNS